MQCQMLSICQMTDVLRSPVYELIDRVSFPSKLWGDMRIDPGGECDVSYQLNLPSQRSR